MSSCFGALGEGGMLPVNGFANGFPVGSSAAAVFANGFPGIPGAALLRVGLLLGEIAPSPIFPLLLDDDAPNGFGSCPVI